MSVLVYIELAKSGVSSTSLEVLGKGKELAAALGTSVVAAVLGGDTAGAAATVAGYGVDVLSLSSPVLADYRLSAYSAALKKAATESNATVLLLGRELAAMVACELGAGYAPDAVDLRVDGGKLVAVRSVYSNNILTDVTFSSPLQVVSVRGRSFPLPEAGGAGSVQAVDPGVDAAAVKETVIEVKATDSGEISLNDAGRIVSGGRGVAADPAKGFALVAELAGTIGAAVGASRAAVDAGFIPYKNQVGQTGKTVKPDLYIAAGISGAIQHLAGMGGSKVIVAINKDKDAPIFEKATYGIVGDLYEVLPALTAELKKRLG
jgi:electron transfer flavoprotein alpha subunit